MNKLLSRSSLVLVITLFSFLLFAPNFLEQELELVFQNDYREETGKRPISDGVIQDFVKDRENGLQLFFPNAKCVFVKAPGQKNRRCRLRSTFITAARVNELTQAHGELINDLKTAINPHPIEKFFGFNSKKGYKNLKIRLGLDLQGGMRAVFKADYDTYQKKLEEKYNVILAKAKAKQSKPGATAQDKKDAANQIAEIERQLDMGDLRKLELLNEARSVITKRLDVLKLSEPEVRVQEASYSIGVDMPGVTNSSSVMESITNIVTVEYRIVNDKKTDEMTRGYVKELKAITALYRKNKGKVDSRDVKDIMDGIIAKSGLKPSDGKLFLLWRRGQKQNSKTLPREFRVLHPVILDGDDMTNASISTNATSGYYDINFELSGAGAEIFGRVTRENINKRLAILWGDRVVSDPVIRGAITGGRGVINGSFSKEEATDVSSVIREGALPLPLEVLSVSFIGPSLGQDSIVAGVLSILVGFILIICYMIGYYKLSGFIANFALFLNLLIIAAILSLLEFTLTLPGFAGVILTVGMAVDANVIIFEKIKEELRLGKSPAIAIESGFKSSFLTILDANVTTLMAAIVLWKVGDSFGDSAIKGFSITLFFGLVSSMFTALFVSRLLFGWAQQLFDLKTLSIGWGIKE